MKKKLPMYILVVGSAPVFRIDGKLIRKTQTSLMPQDTNKVCKKTIINQEMWETLEQKPKTLNFS